MDRRDKTQVQGGRRLAAHGPARHMHLRQLLHQLLWLQARRGIVLGCGVSEGGDAMLSRVFAAAAGWGVADDDGDLPVDGALLRGGVDGAEVGSPSRDKHGQALFGGRFPAVVRWRGLSCHRCCCCLLDTTAMMCAAARLADGATRLR